MNVWFATNSVIPATIAATLAITSPLQAQDGRSPQTAAPPSTVPNRGADSEPDDILVEGYRDRPDIQTSVSNPTMTSAVKNRQAFEYSERIAKCAARNKIGSTARLKAVVDGEFNTTTHAVAQDRLKRTYITCSESPTLLSFTTVGASTLERMAANTQVFGDSGDSRGLSGANDIAPLGWSIYDRGAFTIEALRRFAPELRLTRAQTQDPAVQSRFNLREMPRNRHRLPTDFRYFEVAVCMVRVEPKLAVRLATSEGAARISDTQAALIDRARVCVGGARNVRVDPTQFRIYIADAVYRWAVAATGVDSLIPDQRG